MTTPEWARALPRRLATVDEVLAHSIWRAERIKPIIPGKFDFIPQHRPLASARRDISRTDAAWRDVAQYVLPHAESVALLVETGVQPVVSFTTAVDPDAPPLLAWDTTEQRNPLDWFIPGRHVPLGEFSISGPALPLRGIVADPERLFASTGLRVEAVFGVLDDALPVERMRAWIRSSMGLALHPDFIRPEIAAQFPEGVRDQLTFGEGVLADTPNDEPPAHALHIVRADASVTNVLRVRRRDGRVTEYAIVAW